MGRPAVTGAGEVVVDEAAGEVRIGDRVLRAGERIAIDGSHGTVTTDDVPLVEPQMSEQLLRVLGWCDELRTLGVRANADTGTDTRRALELGAEGIGLCRTEHMFLGERQPLMAAVIMAADERARDAAIERLAPLQQADFEDILQGARRAPGDRPPARPAAARVPAAPRGPAAGLARAPPGRAAAGVQPDAGHPRGSARAAVPAPV